MSWTIVYSLAILAALRVEGANGSTTSAAADLYGDPLPAGALARLGTSRLRPMGEVVCACFSPDSKDLVVGCDDNTVRLWDAATGKEHWKVRDCREVQSVGFSPDGRTILVFQERARTLFLTRSSGKLSRTVQCDRFATLAKSPVVFSFQGNSVAFVEPFSGLAYAADLATGDELCRIITEQPYVLAFSRRGKFLAVGTKLGMVHVCDVGSDKEVCRWRADTQSIYALAFSSDEKQLATGSRDGTIRVWDAATGRSTHVLKGPASAVNCLAYSEGGRHLLAISADGDARQWRLSDGAIEQQFTLCPGHNAVLSPDCKRIAVLGQKVHLWHLHRGATEVSVSGGHAQAIRFLAFSRDGKQLVSAGADQTARVWDVGTAREIMASLHFSTSLLALSSDGRLLVTGSFNLCLHDVLSGKKRATRLDETEVSWRFHFATLPPDASKITAVSGYRSFAQWDLRKGGAPAAWQTTYRNDKATVCACYSDDGTYLASGDSDGRVSIKDTRANFWLKSFRVTHGDFDIRRISCVAFSKNGEFLVIGARDSSIRFCHVKDSVRCCIGIAHFSNCKLSIATASDCSTWNSADGSVRQQTVFCPFQTDA